jgi:hypothetical protein
MLKEKNQERMRGIITAENGVKINHDASLKREAISNYTT